ncbi:preprotein translocase subunit SecG [Balneola vulgaris]|jgi:preprotein translocase subunit SecG|uniref:preprotein translocase subunit SecG n=1 Tax=Balneola vulgaris TaxID=287535 RepID=UPI0003734BF5|nr:preprotein translocase subunit SecG [Balneola vulgaris]
MLYNILVAVITIICALLILVVLLQNGQGSGLSGISGGAGGGLAGNSGLGARRTADLLSKATGIFGGAFLVLCILANFAIDNAGTQPTRSILQEGGAGIPAQDLNAPSETQSAVPVQNNDATGTDNSTEGEN